MSRQVVELKFRVGDRTVLVKAMDTAGPEDVFDTQFRGVLHRLITGEDHVPPAGRDVKDWIIKGNLVI